jgi:hypothetical protein
METQQIKIGVEMSEDLHRRMKSTAAARGMKLKDATREAFEAWLNGASAQPPQTLIRSEDERQWMDRLVNAFRNADHAHIEMIKHAIALAETSKRKPKNRGLE